MQTLENKIAVVTGGATGMGRELVVQLAAAGAHVAACDVNMTTLQETMDAAAAAAPGVRVTAHECDVSDEEAVIRFRDEVVAQHDTDHVHLLFNNAGISGGGSFLLASRQEWDRTFGICWGGVYHCSRAFVPLLVAADEAVLINTSSVNGFWASLGPGTAHTAYSSAKFAVKGFTEALRSDFAINAPHVQACLVMPGHIGTDIAKNSAQFMHGVSPEMAESFGAAFRDNAPMTAADAATEMLDAVRDGRWRVLLGDDAADLDRRVRADPEGVYAAVVGTTTPT